MKTIKITATNETSGVDAEYDYLDNLLGDWKLVKQSVFVEEKVYDVLVVETKNKLQTFWFDICGESGGEVGHIIFYTR